MALTFDNSDSLHLPIERGRHLGWFAASHFHFKWFLTGSQFQEYARSGTMGLDDQRTSHMQRRPAFSQRARINPRTSE